MSIIFCLYGKTLGISGLIIRLTNDRALLTRALSLRSSNPITVLSLSIYCLWTDLQDKAFSPSRCKFKAFGSDPTRPLTFDSFLKLIRTKSHHHPPTQQNQMMNEAMQTLVVVNQPTRETKTALFRSLTLVILSTWACWASSPERTGNVSLALKKSEDYHEIQVSY
ncbi:hypothetical protein CROQUDRAFT_108102 [Cronartium quercuum f. sp. fusiforme G11]|uniref:Uncharacterized protein n=1 Tax=Cronartium quercuum f. sp. fusiforme G11 TaxID=708437 RepID=A0A9P6TAC4_9BASI|nr:hypothetical protein CROQUDRAFT_108102 [Cronartium quercuum f. sp. fusiforme G11]